MILSPAHAHPLISKNLLFNLLPVQMYLIIFKTVMFCRNKTCCLLPCVPNKSVQQLWQGFTQVYFNDKLKNVSQYCVKILFYRFISPAAYLFESSDWKTHCIGHPPAWGMGWLTCHYAGWGQERQEIVLADIKLCLNP
jgi:hypothetical protein